VRIERINCGINQSGHFISFFTSNFALRPVVVASAHGWKSQSIRHPPA
jgi:hypothetical protein